MNIEPKIQEVRIGANTWAIRVSGDDYTAQVIAPKGVSLEYAKHIAMEAWDKRCDPKLLPSWFAMMSSPLPGARK